MLLKIKSYLQQYHKWQISETGLALRHFWETQANWQAHFELENTDLAASYEKALSSQSSRRHYSRRAFEPKKVMLALLRYEPELARATFEDLLREGHTLDGRLSRFGVYIQELFKRYLEAKKDTPWGDHFHGDDYFMPCLYLACQYPDRYVPYQTEVLIKVCQRLGARNLPQAADPVRFMKLAKLLDRFVQEDEKLLEQYRNEFLRPEDYQEESLLLSWHFMCFIAE